MNDSRNPTIEIPKKWPNDKTVTKLDRAYIEKTGIGMDVAYALRLQANGNRQVSIDPDHKPDSSKMSLAEAAELERAAEDAAGDAPIDCLADFMEVFAPGQTIRAQIDEKPEATREDPITTYPARVVAMCFAMFERRNGNLDFRTINPRLVDKGSQWVCSYNEGTFIVEETPNYSKLQDALALTRSQESKLGPLARLVVNQEKDYVSRLAGVEAARKMREPKKTLVGTQIVTEPAFDDNGNAILDAVGNPVLKEVFDDKGKAVREHVYEDVRSSAPGQANLDINERHCQRSYDAWQASKAKLDEMEEGLSFARCTIENTVPVLHRFTMMDIEQGVVRIKS